MGAGMLPAEKTIAVEAVLGDRTLTSTEKLVMIAVIDGTSRPAVTVDWLAQRASLSARTVRYSIGTLETRRFLRVQRHIGSANHYTVLQVKE